MSDLADAPPILTGDFLFFFLFFFLWLTVKVQSKCNKGSDFVWRGAQWLTDAAFYEWLRLSCDYYRHCYRGFCEIRTNISVFVHVLVRTGSVRWCTGSGVRCLFFFFSWMHFFSFFFFSRIFCGSYNLAVIISFTLCLTPHHLTSVMRLNMPYPIQRGMSSSIFAAKQS